MHFSALVSLSLLAGIELVAGHSAIIAATGDQGGQGAGLGVDPNTPRDGTQRNPFQQDSTRFRGAAADGCGETLAGGANQVQAGTTQMMGIMGGTLPQISPGGEVRMTVHQVNADGAGPYTCEIDATGAGTAWQPMQVTTNIAGNARGRNNANSASDLPLVAAVPANQQCSGTVAGQQNVCMVRCVNPANAAGPFGGCVPVQMGGAAAGAPATPAPAPAPAPGAGAGAAAGGAGAAAGGANRAAAGANRAAAGAARAQNNRAANARREAQEEDEEELDERRFAKALKA